MSTGDKQAWPGRGGVEMTLPIGPKKEDSKGACGAAVKLQWGKILVSSCSFAETWRANSFLEIFPATIKNKQPDKEKKYRMDKWMKY